MFEKKGAQVTQFQTLEACLDVQRSLGVLTVIYESVCTGEAKMKDN